MGWGQACKSNSWSCQIVKIKKIKWLMWFWVKMMSDKLFQSHNTHHNLDLRRVIILLFIIYFVAPYGAILKLHFFGDSKVGIPKLSNYESHQFGSS